MPEGLTMRSFRFALAASTILGILTLSPPAAAQSPSNGYVLLAPGVVSGGGEAEPTLGLALDGEAVLTRQRFCTN